MRLGGKLDDCQDYRTACDNVDETGIFCQCADAPQPCQNPGAKISDFARNFRRGTKTHFLAALALCRPPERHPVRWRFLPRNHRKRKRHHCPRSVRSNPRVLQYLSSPRNSYLRSQQRPFSPNHSVPLSRLDIRVGRTPHRRAAYGAMRKFR